MEKQQPSVVVVAVVVVDELSFHSRLRNCPSPNCHVTNRNRVVDVDISTNVGMMTSLECSTVVVVVVSATTAWECDGDVGSAKDEVEVYSSPKPPASKIQRWKEKDFNLRINFQNLQVLYPMSGFFFTYLKKKNVNIQVTTMNDIQSHLS